MRSLAEELRRAAREALPSRAFLRRDRGDALFVSDALRLCPGGDWGDALARAGFLIESDGGLLRLCPGPAWLRALESRFPEPPDDFCASLVRFAGMDADAESLALFALGARRLEGEPDGGRFDKKLRQRAAECLRLNRTTEGPTHGGGLYACALLRYIIEEE